MRNSPATPEEIAAIAKGLGPNARQVVRSLSGEYAPAPRYHSRQLTASVAMRHPSLIEREWQDGCAQSTYYRLTPLGIALKAHLEAQGG
jgi:hypothetical protein